MKKFVAKGSTVCRQENVNADKLMYPPFPQALNLYSNVMRD